MDPVRPRVAIPAADPPDNITHVPFCTHFGALVLVGLFDDGHTLPLPQGMVQRRRRRTP
ncbi:hypothetical protein GRI75_13095 [Altererythrobacter soli]|uniref:Uncharacterized protein n=1 Tax=Croceibacterium soli TaxID=1739690 RepID=A0A6I4V0Q3_9SPHN|nr:hypothetical protein [Croceibacterium soli]